MKTQLCAITLLLLAVLPSRSQTVTGSFTHGGTTRNYRVYLPAGFSAATSLPLVINMHGRGSNGFQQELYTGMNSVADTGRFVVTYPDAVTYQGEVQWNSFGLSATPDDVGFLSALIDTLHKKYNIDLSRVYATGLSSGGFMAYKLGCALSCRIAAIAPVAGLLIDHPLAPCSLSRPVSLFHIHGTADNVVPYTGLGTFGVYSVPGSIASWRSKIGCPASPIVTNLPDISPGDGSTVIDSSYRPCNSSAEITLYAVINGGHTWPGAVGPNTNQDFKASSAIWNFVKKYSVPPALLSISGLASSYCQGAAAVTLTGTPSGGTFSGTGVSGTTFNPAGLNPGTYTVTYTRSSGGCTYTTTATTTITEGVTASISPATVTICGGSVTLTASGGGAYSWSTGSAGASITVSPSSTTTYTVTVTSGGCTATASRTVTVTTGITASIIPVAAAICSGESITLTASGGTTYSWSNGMTAAAITVSPSVTTTYSVTVTDAGLCSATASRTVTVNAIPTVTVNSPAPVCSGASVTLTASGGITYSWSNGTAAAAITVMPSSTTNYSVTVTDAYGCTAAATRTVTVNPLPAATASANPASVIQGGSVILTAAGGVQYSWSSGQTAASFTDSPSITQTYSVTVTDANGCNATAQVTVTVLPSGISEAELFVLLNVYPNPAAGVLNIEYQTQKPAAIEIEFFSLEGKKVHGAVTSGVYGTNHLQISMQELNLRAGVCLIRFHGAAGIIIRKAVFIG